MNDDDDILPLPSAGDADDDQASEYSVKWDERPTTTGNARTGLTADDYLLSLVQDEDTVRALREWQTGYAG